jgi:hypothetical protein
MPIDMTPPVRGADYLNAYMRNAIGVQALLDQQREAAVRWQGAQEYNTLIQSGVDPREALQRSGPKLFFNDPRALAATVPSMLSQEGQLYTDPQTGEQYTIDRYGQYKHVYKTPDRLRYTAPGGINVNRALQPGETAPAPGAPNLDIREIPGVGYIIMNPSGTSKLVPNPISVTEKGKTEKITSAEDLRRQEWAKVESFASDIAQWQKNIDSGNTRWGPEGGGVFSGEMYQTKIDRAKDMLKQAGFNEDGTIIPGSDLDLRVKQLNPAYQFQPAPAPGVTQAAPGVFHGQGYGYGGQQIAPPTPPPAAPPPAAPPPAAPPPAAPGRTPTGFQPIPAQIRAAPIQHQIFKRDPASGRWVRDESAGVVSREAQRRRDELIKQKVIERIGPRPNVQTEPGQGIAATTDENGNLRYGIFWMHNNQFVRYAD